MCQDLWPLSKHECDVPAVFFKIGYIIKAGLGQSVLSIHLGGQFWLLGWFIALLDILQKWKWELIN